MQAEPDPVQWGNIWDDGDGEGDEDDGGVCDDAWTKVPLADDIYDALSLILSILIATRYLQSISLSTDSE